MAEIGMSMEPPKKGFVEGLRRAFTVGGAKEKWYQDHKDLVLKYTDVHNGLNDEQRAQVMQQIENDATKSAKIAVGKHVGAAVLTTAVLGFGGGLVGSERFRNFVAKGKLFNWEFGKGLATLGEKGAGHLGDAKKWLDKVIDGPKQWVYKKILPDSALTGAFDAGATVASAVKK